MSGTEVRISRIEGIQCLLGETSVAKNCPATPVVHGTLHLGIGGRQPVRILCRRSVRCAPCVRFCFRARRWSLAGGGAVGNLSGCSPARSLRPEDSTNVNMPGRNNTREAEGALYLCAGISVRTSFLFAPRVPAAPRWLAAAGSASPLGNLPFKTRSLSGKRKCVRIDSFSKG